MDISRGAYARKFRGDRRNTFQNGREVAQRYKEVLDNTYEGDDSKCKRAADDHGSTPRAAENWFVGDNAPTLAGFLHAYHSNPKFQAWARKLLLLEQDFDPEFQAHLAAFIAAVRNKP